MSDRKASNWAGAIVAYVAVVSVGAAANILPIAGQRTGDVSAKYSSLFTPAGYTFGIWSLIYTALACFVVYQALPAQRCNASLERIARLFIWSCAANVLWMFAWHYELIMVSLLLMFALLALLVLIYRSLEFGNDSTSIGERLFINLPFALYTAWVTVASIANISAMQAALQWNDKGLNGIDWTLLKLAIAGAIGASVVARNRDFVFGLVVAWAAFGIASGQASTPMVAGGAMTIGVAIVLLSIHELARRIR